MEEENALLRKEIAVIKRRVGIPPDQSILSPEERAQCVLEFKHACLSKGSRCRKGSSSDEVSSTSSVITYSSPQHQRVDQLPSCLLESSDRSIDGSTTKEDSHSPQYGSFCSSPCWVSSNLTLTPTSSSNDLCQNYCHQTDNHCELTTTSVVFQDKNNIFYNHFMKGRTDNCTQPSYDCCMRHTRQEGQFL